MNYSYKLKIRQLAKESKQEPSIRRIRTDYIDNSKKTGSTIRAPLADNKKIFNQNQTSTLKTKKSTGIKTVINKNQGTGSRLTTQPVQKSNYHHQKHLSDKLFNPKKTTTSTVNNYSFKKKQVRDSVGRTQNKSQIAEPKKGQSRYQMEEKIGSGTFGTVHKARDKNTLEVVAIKKVFQDKNYKNRQLQILKLLKHPNVLEMKDSFFTYENSKEYLNVVMDFYGCNLYQSIHKYSKRSLMPRLKFKVYAYQLFRSLLYLKNLGIAHRDIKPQNILVNEQNLKLVMCDFGSAKQLRQGEPNISYICSRCYRAPQLIFGNTQYTTQIDMWSAGCVIGQMLIIKPLFQGDSNIDQLVEIIKLLGCPSTTEILEMNPDYDISKFQLPKIGAKSWQKIFPSNEYLGDGFIDLMKNVLCFSPHKRYTPVQALQHPFFDELRQKNIYQQLKDQVCLPDLFDFGKTMQIGSEDRQKLIPKWY